MKTQPQQILEDFAESTDQILQHINEVMSFAEMNGETEIPFQELIARISPQVCERIFQNLANSCARYHDYFHHPLSDVLPC